MSALARIAALAGCTGALVIALDGAPQRMRGSGLDPADFDRSVRPQDDLYGFANGGWIDRTALPDDRVTYTAAAELQEEVEADLRDIIEALAHAPDMRAGSTAQQIADLYASMQDTARLEALGVAPLRAQLDRIDGVRTTDDLAAVAGELSAATTSGPFFSSAALDPRTGERVVHLSQGGILLPDREYYLSLAGDYPAIRRQYRDYLARIFSIAGRAAPAADADAVLALEIELARAQWAQVESRDPARTWNSYTLSALSASMRGFNWKAWAAPQGIDRVPLIVVGQPSFFRQFAALVPAMPLESWKAWLAARYITASAPYTNAELNMARFEFFGRILTGQEEPRTRWKRGVGLVNAFLGDAIGRLYVEKRFPPESRARARRIVGQIVRAFRDAIRESDWMSPRAKGEALDKLATLTERVGYPDRWKDYGGLRIDARDLIGNVSRAQRFDNAYRMERVTRPDDRGFWLMTPQTVNAYYSPTANEIVFPAAILQPPYFDADADDAVNYGAIGSVVGHELGHAFDDLGRRFDGRGAVRDWWTPRDESAYRARVQTIVEQYYGYQPLPGMRVNGSLTLVENAGDLAGLSIAFRAYRQSLGGRPAPEIDGFTGDQRFFLGWARIWRSKTREGELRKMLLSSPYAPNPYRANGPLGHVPGFYEAFGVQPGDRLFRRPETRTRIW